MTAVALASAAALAGCYGKQQTNTAAGQVIAHVGSDDVTQQELDNEVRLSRIPPDKRTDQVIKAMLGRIAERKYLERKAVDAKLDQDPVVALDILRSREQVLAAAYVQRDLDAKIGAISQKDIESYIQTHSDRFADRKVFQIEQATFAPQKDMESLAAATKGFRTLDQVEAKLRELGVKYNRGPAALDGATLPPQMLKPLETRKPDDIFFLRSATSASFFQVLATDNAPLTGEQANAFAKREIASEMARKEAQNTATAALEAAKFEGDYARIMKLPTPGAAAGTETSEGEQQSAEKPPVEPSPPPEPPAKPAKALTNPPKK